MRRYLFLAAVSILGAAAITVSSQVMKYPNGAAVVLSAIVGCGGTSVNVDSNSLYVDCSNNRVGFGTTSPATVVDVSGAFQAGSGVNKSTITSIGQVLLSTSVRLGNVTSVIENGSMAYDQTGGFLTLGSGSTVQMVLMGAWKSWGPTYTGYSADPTGTGSYTVIGKTVCIHLESGAGTSNSNAVTITLPFAARTTAQQFVFYGNGRDAGVDITSMTVRGDTRSGSAVADVYINAAAQGWSNSGSRIFNINGCYEAN